MTSMSIRWNNFLYTGWWNSNHNIYAKCLSSKIKWITSQWKMQHLKIVFRKWNAMITFLGTNLHFIFSFLPLPWWLTCTALPPKRRSLHVVLTVVFALCSHLSCYFKCYFMSAVTDGDENVYIVQEILEILLSF